jgi:hypothetical protein
MVFRKKKEEYRAKLITCGLKRTSMVLDDLGHGLFSPGKHVGVSLCIDIDIHVFVRVRRHRLAFIRVVVWDNDKVTAKHFKNK